VKGYILGNLQRRKLKYPQHFVRLVCSLQHVRKTWFSIFSVPSEEGGKYSARNADFVKLETEQCPRCRVSHDYKLILPSECFKLLFREGIFKEAAICLFEVIPFFFRIQRGEEKLKKVCQDTRGNPE
jgi:hypothetical protein